MRPRLNGSVMFVFSDPGGAKPCLSLIEENQLVNVMAISDREYSFYKDFKTNVNIINCGFEQITDTFKPDLIITGTSYTSSIERQFIKIARKKKIPCYSFVDHWTNISKRFLDEENYLILPDKIWVIDERAELIALAEGVDRSKIVVSGNPYHDWLRQWKPDIEKSDFLNNLGLNNEKLKILVYAPDPLTNISGHDIYGFDELSATTIISELLDNYHQELKNWLFLVKCHPNQNRKKLSEVISDRFFILPDDVDTNTTIYYADVVMGFFSSFLIEASIMNKPVIRFLPKEVINDPIIDLNIGKIVNKNTFVETLLKF